MLKYILLLTVCLVASVRSRTVCYDDLGCFTDEHPFSWTLQRPLAFLPDTPARVSTKFTLFNKNNLKGEIINADILGDNYDATKETKFIVHGFLHNAIKRWVIDLKDALLSAGDFNVITVDWSKGNGLPYTQATANTQIAGAEIAKLIKAMVNKRDAKPRDFHCIGHSLGSHVCGYAGERTPGMGRISGLDPAGPYFENTDKIVRLDPSDALFVDNLHSDGTANLLLGLGMMQAIGHVDFYPNGGKNQPDCPATSGKILGAIFGLLTIDVDGIEDSTACSHSSALYLYIDSITSSKCKYTSYSCNSEKDFEQGRCIQCSSKGCNRMGFWASPDNDLGTQYLNTKAPLLKKDTCRQNHVAALVSNNLSGQDIAAGKFQINFETQDERSTWELLDDYDVRFTTGSTEIRLVSLDKPLTSEIEKLYVSYIRTSNIFTWWWYDKQWAFRHVDVVDGDRQTTTRYCPSTPYIQSGTNIVFNKC